MSRRSCPRTSQTTASHIFPQDGDYEIEIRLARDRDEKVEGLRESHLVELLLDRQSVRQFTVKPTTIIASTSRVRSTWFT